MNGFKGHLIVIVVLHIYLSCSSTLDFCRLIALKLDKVTWVVAALQLIHSRLVSLSLIASWLIICSVVLGSRSGCLHRMLQTHLGVSHLLLFDCLLLILE